MPASKNKKAIALTAAICPASSGAGRYLLAICLLMSSGCLKRDYPPRGAVVSHVEVETADPDRSYPGIDESELLSQLATVRTPRFLGIWEGVAFDYEVFDENVFARDLERVERYFHSKGYYEAKVIAGRVLRLDERHVRAYVRVAPGQPVITASVELPGLETLPFDVAFEAQKAVSLCGGGVCDETDLFNEEAYQATRAALERVLLDHGYAFAMVEASASVDVARHLARVRYRIQPGPLATYGKIHVTGLVEIPEQMVRNALQLEEGERYSQADIIEARSALVSLGVFSAVDIHENKSSPRTRSVPLIIDVRESSLRAVRAGVGARLDQLEVSNTLRLGWESRNFLGGMRRFQIDTRPGVTYFPTRLSRLEAPTNVFPHNRLRLELRQPDFIEGRTTGFTLGEYNIYPLMFPLAPGANPEDEFVIGYNELRAVVGLERAFFNQRLVVTPTYNWQINYPFVYKETRTQARPPDGFGSLLISYPELVSTLDLRDDAINPRRGIFVSNSVQVAGHLFPGDVSDVRVRPEVRTYLPLSRDVVLATKAGFGFLFPANYGETLRETVDGVPVVITNPRSAEVVRDQHKLLFRALYSGGPNSNRGYSFREVGPHGPVGFLLRGGDVNCFNPANDAERAQCVRPLGGVLLWELSLEVRFPVTGPLGAVAFVDASHVNRSMKWRFDAPHVSPGLGLRYQTPVGPLRFDAGWRLLEHVGSPPEHDELQDEARTEPFLGFAPVAIHIALGDAF